jgi:hypothetical protein
MILVDTNERIQETVVLSAVVHLLGFCPYAFSIVLLTQHARPLAAGMVFRVGRIPLKYRMCNADMCGKAFNICYKV